MPKQCNNCLGLNHIKVNCESDKKDWFTYIEDLMGSGDFRKDLFGNWPEIIRNKRREIQGRGKPPSDKNDTEKDKDAPVKGRPKGRGRGRGK